MKDKRRVKAGRKGGIMGTGKAKKRGSAAYYAELGRKSGLARAANRAARSNA